MRVIISVCLSLRTGGLQLTQCISQSIVLSKIASYHCEAIWIDSFDETCILRFYHRHTDVANQSLPFKRNSSQTQHQEISLPASHTETQPSTFFRSGEVKSLSGTGTVTFIKCTSKCILSVTVCPFFLINISN